MANDYAVSPVIGVMLMIVVTVILAAVVSAFAGDMGSTAVKAAPTSTFEFKIYEKYVAATYSKLRTDGQPYVIVTLKNGETLDTRDLKIVSTRKDADGNPIVFTYDPSGGSGNKNGLFSWSGVGNPAACYKMFGGDDGAYMRTGDRYTGTPASVLGTTPKTGDVFQIEVIYKPSSMVIWSSEVIVI